MDVRYNRRDEIYRTAPTSLHNKNEKSTLFKLCYNIMKNYAIYNVVETTV